LEFNVPFQHKYGYIRDENYRVNVYKNLTTVYTNVAASMKLDDRN